MQQTEKRKIVINNNQQEVYKFLKDPRNYLTGLNEVQVDNKGATFNVPMFGKIRADITNLIENQKIVMYSKEINTSITVNLENMGDSKTEVELSVVSKPNCGLLKNMAISMAVPRLLNVVVESFKERGI